MMSVESIVFDIFAKDRASSVIEKIGHASSTTTSKMDKFHKVGAAAGVALAGGLAIATKAAFEFTKEAAANQQSAALLARVLHTAAGATKEQTAATEEWITKQGEQYGIAKNELRPALSKLAVATGDVTQAQKLASLAMDVSVGTGKSLTTVAFALAKAQNGNVSGLARLGVATTKTTKNTAGLAVAQTAVKSATLAYTAAVKAHGKSSAEASIALDKLKQSHTALKTAQTATTKTTLSLDQITKNLSKTYSGAAAKSADTAAGRQKILTFEMEELRVKIGTALIPVMLKLTNVGMKVVEWIDHNTKTAGILIGVIGSLLAVTYAVSAATKLYTTYTTIASVATKLFAKSTEEADAALVANPIGLVVVALIALAAGLIYAYKHSEKFRHVVQAAMASVKVAIQKAMAAGKVAIAGFVHAATAFWNKFGGTIMGVARAAFGALKAIIGGDLKVIQGVIKVITSAIHGDWSGVWQGLKMIVQGALQAVLGIIRGQLAIVKALFGSLPGKIKGALGDLGSLLYQSGKDLINGLWDGVKRQVGGFLSYVGSVAGKVKSAFKNPLGIFSPSKVFRGYGQNIMDGLLQGIADRKLTVQKAIEDVAGAIQKIGDLISNALGKISNLQSIRAGFAGTFTADSVFGQDLSTTTTDAEGNDVTSKATAADLIAFQRQQAKQAHRLLRDVKNVTKRGLSKALVKQLQSEGTAGAETLHALAQGSKQDIDRLNRLNKQTSASLRAAGMRAGNAARGGSIDKDIRVAQQQEHTLERQEDILKRLEHHLQDIAHSQKKDQTIVVEIDGEAVVRSIVRRNKRKGVKTAGV